MVNQHFHTIVFQPVNSQNRYVRNDLFTNTRNQVVGNFNKYFVKALAYIQYIIRMLQSSSKVIEKYGPVMEELPKMYQLVKAFNELKEEETKENKDDDAYHTTEQNRTYVGPSPTLFI